MRTAAAREERAKQIGMQLAAWSSREKLNLAREIAIELGRKHQFVNADMVNDVLRDDYGIETIGNAGGTMFRFGPFKPTGIYHKSKKPGSHRNRLIVWEYIG